MASSVVSRVKLNRQSTGRRRYTFKMVRKAVSDLGGPQSAVLVDWIDRSIAHDRQTSRLERRWRRVKAARSAGRGRSAEVGAKIERAVGGMYRTLLGTLDALDADSPHAAKLRECLDKYFADGSPRVARATWLTRGSHDAAEQTGS